MTHAEIARRVALAMDLSERPCVGEDCDLNAPCARHRRIPEVVGRYLRLRARKGKN